jgi:CHAT domain-containing protein
LQDRKILARCYKNQAVIFYFQEKYQPAEAALQRAFQYDDEKKFYGLAFLLQGQIAVIRGEYDRALNHYELALDHFQANDLDSLNMASALNRLAVVNVLTGNYENALSFENRALALRRQTLNTEETAWSLSNLGLIYSRMDSLDKAIAMGQQALHLFKSSSKQTLINTWLNLGGAYLKKGEFDSAGAAFHHAVSIADTIKSDLLTLEAKIGQGFVALNQAQPEQARDFFASALGLTKKAKDANFMATALFGLSQAKRKLNDLAGAVSDLDQAITAVEQLRSNLSQDSMRISYFATYQDIFDQAILSTLAQGREELALHYAERARARALRDALTAAMPAADQPEVVKMPAPALQTLQSRIPVSAQVIEYRITPDTLIIWLIERQKIIARRVAIPSTRLAQIVHDFLTSIGAIDLKTFMRRVDRDRKAVYHENRQIGHQLYQILWEPIAGAVTKNKRLFIVPDGVLHRLPFGALVTSDDRFFAEQYLWVKAPGLAVLAEKSDHFLYQDKPQPTRLLMVADDLPSVNAQTKLLSRLFVNPVFLIKYAATYEALQKRLGEDANVIYFSVHAVADERFPMNSYLELYDLDGEKGHPRKIKVYARELLQLDFDKTWLAVINACKTASGKIAAGEGVLNLVRIFALKKVPVVIATLWENDDRFSAEMTNEFFKRAAAATEYSMAIHQARLHVVRKLQRDYEVALPYFWAVFEVYQNSWDTLSEVQLN